MWAALNGGCTKRMVLPTAVNSRLGEIVTDPEEVKNATCEYLNDLYHRDQPPRMEKPWLNSPRMVTVRQRVELNPFRWPQEASLGDFRAIEAINAQLQVPMDGRNGV